MPPRCETVLRIDPSADPDHCVSTVGGPFHGLNLWEGGVVGLDGALYCMPLKCDRVMRIAPPGTPPINAGPNASKLGDKSPNANGPWYVNMLGCF